jgi:hypothetical protein
MKSNRKKDCKGEKENKGKLIWAVVPPAISLPCAVLLFAGEQSPPLYHVSARVLSSRVSAAWEGGGVVPWCYGFLRAHFTGVTGGLVDEVRNCSVKKQNTARTTAIFSGSGTYCRIRIWRCTLRGCKWRDQWRHMHCRVSMLVSFFGLGVDHAGIQLTQGGFDAPSTGPIAGCIVPRQSAAYLNNVHGSSECEWWVERTRRGAAGEVLAGSWKWWEVRIQEVATVVICGCGKRWCGKQ